MEKHRVLYSLQHGFHSGHLCEHLLIITINDIMQKFYSKQYTDLIILDLTFDAVHNRKLIYKLNDYGINM